MQSYQFPLPSAHGWLVAFLLRIGRKAGWVAPAAAGQHMSRRHRMMFAVDERHASGRGRNRHRPGSSPPAIAAASRATYFGSFCSSLVTMHDGGHEPSVSHQGERPRGNMDIVTRLRTAQRHLRLEQQHRERVRRCGLDDRDATTGVDARQRQIALLQRLGQIVR